MKISDEVLRAAEKAAKERGKTLDAWVEETLSTAASAKPSTIEARLDEISGKLDRIADRQSLGEKATDRLSATLQELDSAFRRGRKGAGHIIEQAEAVTSSAAGEVAEKVRELISRASAFAGTLSSRGDDAREAATRPMASKATRPRTRRVTSPGKDVAEPSALKAKTERTRKTAGARKKAPAVRPSRSERGTDARSKSTATQRRSRPRG